MSAWACLAFLRRCSWRPVQHISLRGARAGRSAWRWGTCSTPMRSIGSESSVEMLLLPPSPALGAPAVRNAESRLVPPSGRVTFSPSCSALRSPTVRNTRSSPLPSSSRVCLSTSASHRFCCVGGGPWLMSKARQTRHTHS